MKIFGLLLIIVGFLILKYFPGLSDHQKKEMTMSGILVGVILFLVGIGLIIFG